MKRGRSLEGVPWHTEFLKVSEDDERRHKNKCIYYNNGKCTLNIYCYGSSRCKHYKTKPISENKEKNIRIKKEKTKREKPILGTFVLRNLDTGDLEEYVIGKNISQYDKLITTIKNRNQNSVFVYENIRYKIVKKNLYYKLTNKTVI